MGTPADMSCICDEPEKKFYACMRELSAEALMIITSYIIFFIGMGLYAQTLFYNRSRNIHQKKLISDKVASFFLSSAYALFLPLMSYLFSRSQLRELLSHSKYERAYVPVGGIVIGVVPRRAEIILIWMVLIEIIRVHDDSPFELLKSSEQLVRLFWVGFLVSSYSSLQGMRASLLLLCIYCFILEVLKAIMFNVGNDSCLIGNNPKLIHNYVKKIMLHDDLQTTPMSTCDYIVLGEENHQIAVRSNGYHLGEKKSNIEGMLTIGRVFQLASEDEVLTSRYPYWRDTCLSLALAKMLRRRFAKLPVDEAGCKKALDFVLEGLIDYIGNNRDIQTDKNDGKRNPMERVFSIIQEELKLVYEFMEIKVPTSFYFPWYLRFSWIGILIVFGNLFLVWVSTITYVWEQDNDSKHCYVARKIFSFLDAIITLPLSFSSLFISIAWGAKLYNERWFTLIAVKSYIKDPEWIRSNKSLVIYKMWEQAPRLAKWIKQFIDSGENVKEVRVYSSLLDAPAETIFFCIKVDVPTLAQLPKWIRRIIPRSFPTVVHSTDTKAAILMSLKNSAGRLTNGETSLRNHQMEDLKWACQPNGSTTEAILIWHIATTLLHHQKPSPDLHQEPVPEQNNNTAFKNQEVALALSSYCHYLVEYLPELLPDEVESTEEIYESVRKEILAPPRSCCQKLTENDRCNYLLQTSWGESSVVGNGVKLANNLMDYAENGKPVWIMLADFWAELLLFIAPSDNVEGHQKILNQEELITQIWALLTHAGIVTRPKSTEHQDHESESNAVTGDLNV